MPLIFWIIFGILFCSVHIQAQENTDVEPSSIEEQIFEQIGFLTLLELAPLTREEIIERLKTDLNIHVQSQDESLFDRYFLSYIYNYFKTMQPDSLRVAPYNLYSSEEISQELVSLQSGNDLYFSKNAGDHTITKRFKEVMDAVFNQEVLADEIQMTFEYNNELYAQLNEVVLSSEDITNFMNKHSGITFSDESDSSSKPFTRDELLMILKQYLELPVHIRDNLALRRIIRVKDTFSLFNIFSTILGQYHHRTETITLTDAAFEKSNTDDKGEGTFLHEIGHALWGKSIWKGLPNEAKKEYEKLSWQKGEKINDEFISDYSATNIQEDFSEHFSAYINNGEKLKQEVTAKYHWFREYIFLNVEYITDVAGHLKIFVESEHGDTNPPYFVGLPYEAFKIEINVDESKEDFWRNGYANIKVEVSRLFDDSSEIKQIGILLQSKNDNFWIESPENFQFCSINGIDWENQVSENCIFIDPKKPGWYAFHTSEKLALSYPGDYKITQIKLEDKAGNKKTLRSNLGSAVIPFPGTRDRIAEEAQKKKRQLQTLEQERAKSKEETRRKKAAKEAKGFNILNLSENPVRLYQNNEELTILKFGECLSIMESELPLLSIETTNKWFESFICSNTNEDESRCWIGATSLVKQHENEEYVLVDYKNEFSADFSKCRLSPAKKEERDRQARLKKVSEKINGFNIVNLSENPVKIYQGQQDVLDLQPLKCIRMTEQELSSLSLKTRGSLSSWNPICSNIENSLNISQCNIHSASLIKQNEDGEYVLTDYQGEKSADFYQCRSLTTQITSVLGDLAKEARRKKSIQEAKGFNILNLSEIPVRLEQNGEELRILEFGECISIVEQELSSLRLKTISGWFDLELDTLICSNMNEGVSRCRVNATSLIKQNEDGEYVLADYQGEKSADFRRCLPSPSKIEDLNRKSKVKKTVEEITGFNIFNLSDLPVRIYQGQKAVLDMEPQQCTLITEQELLELTLRKKEGSFICTNIENSLNIDKCNITSTSLFKKNEDGEYVLTNYQGEKSVDFSQCIPLEENAEFISREDDNTTANPSESTPEEKKSDNTPPYLLNSPDESFSVSVEKHDKKHAFIKVEVNGLFDDSSEIKYISIKMKSKDDRFQLKPPSATLCKFKLTESQLSDHYDTCIFADPDTPGRYIYYDEESRISNYLGDYRIQEVYIHDTAGNIRELDNFDDISDMYFPGTRLQVNKRTMKDDLEITTSQTIHGDTVAHILTTDMTIFEHDISISIVNMESEEEHIYKIDIGLLPSLNTSLNSPEVSDKMSLPIVIPKEWKSGTYRLNWIAFDQSQYHVKFSKSNPNNYFDHISNEENSIARPVVDDIVMEVLKGENTKGGDTSIDINIPIEGLDKGKGSLKVIIRTPTGNRMSLFASLSSNPHDGFKNVSGVLQLPPQHAEGEYMITHITTTEDFSSAINRRINHRGLVLHKGGVRVHEERLLERKIRTTLTVSTPKPPQVETKH